MTEMSMAFWSHFRLLPPLKQGPPLEGAYNPTDFNDLDVKPEIRDLFQFITE
jgi:hypothetical protein